MIFRTDISRPGGRWPSRHSCHSPNEASERKSASATAFFVSSIFTSAKQIWVTARDSCPSSPMRASTGRQRGIACWLPSCGACEARCGAMPLDVIVAEDGSSAVSPFAVGLAVLAKGKFGHRHGSSRPCLIRRNFPPDPLLNAENFGRNR